jgi:hypothetical protein
MAFTEQLSTKPEHPAFDLMAVTTIITEQGDLNNPIQFGPRTQGDFSIAKLSGFVEEDNALAIILGWEPGEVHNLILDQAYRDDYECSDSGGGVIEDYEIAQSYSRAVLDLESDSWILWSQTWYPGWNYYLDGFKIGPVLRGNYTFMAACVPEGEHVVEFKYQPLSIRVGAFISLASLSGILGLYLLRSRSGEEEIN